MGNTPIRCPVCNGFGSTKLGGYCKNHFPKGIDEHLNRSEYRPNYGTHQGDFFKDSYGLDNDTYPIDRR